MTTLLLVRHGRTQANASGVLAGWTPGISLDETGVAQASTLASRLAPIPVAAVVTSPLERCQETATALLSSREGLTASIDERIAECRYGDWTGRKISELTKDPLWKVVQQHASAARFPGPDGESILDMQHRAVESVREWNVQLGPDAVWIAVSHADVIKAILADALGQHLDTFQRIQIDPCSLSVVRYTTLRPFVLRVNDTGGGVDGLIPPKRGRRRRSAAGAGAAAAIADSDAVVGGGAGP
jgi:probable phosphomutase (TIGR03848 family)